MTGAYPAGVTSDVTMRQQQLEPVRHAVGQARWADALELINALGDAGRTPEALELLAAAAYGNGELEACIAAWERLHEVLRADGDRLGAARAAAMIAMYLMMDTGLMAPVRAWIRRAESLLDGGEETAVSALVAMVRTYERFMSGDMDEAGRQAAAAIDLGTRFAVNPAVVIGRTAMARVHVLNGEVARGLAELDDVGLILMAGGADSLTTGMMYCELICAAQGLGMFEVAAEWTEVMERWRHEGAIGGINGRCRVHRAELLRLTGPCDEAEQEALGACDELRPWMRREFGWPLVELGTIRLRKGDLDGAGEAFRAAHAHAWQAQPGLALLQLERGDAHGAAESIAEAVAHPDDIPSKERPPFGQLRLTPLLDAQAEIAYACRDEVVAAQAAEALNTIAARFPSRTLAACAALADARLAVLRGEPDLAVRRAGQAISTWADLGAPYETASAREVLGAAHRMAGNADAAEREWRAAGDAFEQYGATHRAARVSALLGGVVAPEPARPAGDTRGGAFTSAGGLRTVAFAGATVQVRDLIGFRYLARLLAAPGREFHVLDLVAVERGTLPTGGAEPADDLHAGGAGLALIDEQARAAYRERLAEVDDDIEEARASNDLGRLERAERDREYLVAELTHAVGLGGRLRRSGSDTERARTSVARSIRYALDRLHAHHPLAATHLRRAVRTGTYCAYESDPASPVAWTL
jgi:tetratricopeptide (TPR) repeat protein